MSTDRAARGAHPPAPGLWARVRLALLGGFAVGNLPRRILILDLCERTLVAAVFFRFVYRFLSQYSDTENVILVLLVIGEALPFVYIMLRAPSATLSQRPLDWGFGVLGAVLPTLVSPAASAGPLLPLPICLAILLAGILLQMSAKIVLGRAFGIVAANRGVRVLGPYRFVRHPMYAGYTITHIGFLLATPAPVNAMIYFAALTSQIARILCEERVLGRDPSYRALCGRVRYRLLPGIF